jgi:hypothetical protein
MLYSKEHGGEGTEGESRGGGIGRDVAAEDEQEE